MDKINTHTNDEDGQHIASRLMSQLNENTKCVRYFGLSTSTVVTENNTILVGHILSLL